MNFIGVDVHQNKLTVACINEELNDFMISDMTSDELINFIKDQSPKVIAVDAPYRLNSGLMNDENYRLNLRPQLKNHYHKKVSEYELSKRGMNPFSTPGSMDEVTGWKDWMNTGFNLYKTLKSLDYQEVNEQNVGSSGFIEVFPHACFTVLLDYVPSKKSTSLGLQQRIEVLEANGLKGVSKCMEGLGRHKTADQLDALVAAYTAYLCDKKEVSFLGDISEGQIVLPVKMVKDVYKRLK